MNEKSKNSNRSIGICGRKLERKEERRKKEGKEEEEEERKKKRKKGGKEEYMTLVLQNYALGSLTSPLRRHPLSQRCTRVPDLTAVQECLT